MSSSAELYLAYKIANAPLNMFPYPHFYVENVFPPEFYAEIQAHLPDSQAMLPIEAVRPVRGYNERFVMELGGKNVETLPAEKKAFWGEFMRWLRGARFGEGIISKFQPLMVQRFGVNPNLEFYDDVLLVEDITRYSLGPHTDAAHKVITMLFYLPKDESQKHLGTSIYVPRDPSFRCPGGPHHPHEDFERVLTMPFMPNALFAFFKTDNSFHGVEPLTDPDTRRWLLLYDIYVKEVQPQPAKPQPAGEAEVKFSF